jgi:hypothetical protein
MAATYTQLPVHIPTLIREVVSEVSDNLASETSLSIANVQFYCETWDVLRQRLIEDGKAESTKNSRYPFIALIRGYDEKYRSGGDYVDTSLTLVIVTRSTPNMKSEDRESENYTPILYPIYAELMEVLNNTRFIMNRNRLYPTHTKHDNLNLGQETPNGNIANRLPDFVDAIIVSNLELTLSVESCLRVGNVNDYTLIYLNVVKEIALTADSNSVTVELVEVNYVEVPSESTPAYWVYLSHLGEEEEVQSIVEGGTVEFSTVHVSDGNYYGYVSCEDGHTSAKLYFWYTIRNEVCVAYTERNIMNLTNFNVSGLDSDYPFDVVTYTLGNRPVIIYRGIAANGGTIELDSETTYAPKVDEAEELTYSLNANTAAANHDVQVILTVEVGYNEILQLESTAYYKLI